MRYETQYILSKILWFVGLKLIQSKTSALVVCGDGLPLRKAVYFAF
jgi:hypothetical protein